MNIVTFEDIKNNPDIQIYIRKADESLGALGYTEHAFAHVTRTAQTANYLLTELGYSERDAELVKIAAYMHDIGNIVNRVDHAQSGAVMAFRILDNLGMPADELATVIGAIGNHDEGTGVPVNHVAAALIIADKTDVRRTRVRNQDIATFDIHDRVNYAVVDSRSMLSEDKKYITLELTIDTHICAVMDYFEIFLRRMLLCRKAAEFLGLTFKLVINNNQLL
ncbi:MAG: hypothetical protein K0R90_27 [Oscillospiraceae bacterium]|jgi:metal-dependent HD superfamily phosphatase/phosphodiesterase|nr:hypothetical protein [Oscillospiraceae bacterium]